VGVNVLPATRAEVLRVLHRLTAGTPTLTTDDLAGQPLSAVERRLLNAAGDDDLALLNACLAVEGELHGREFVALERLLTYCQFADGPLDERLAALPARAFAGAALGLYELGWVNTSKED
jgi:hypothetical protein